MHVLSTCIFWLETNVGVVRGLLSFLRALSKFGSVAEIKNLTGESRQGSVDMIFGPLQCKQVDQIKRRSVELFEHLVARSPLRQEAFTDLPKDLDAVVCADFGATQCLGELWTNIRIVEFALCRLQDDATTTKFDQQIDHLRL